MNKQQSQWLPRRIRQQLRLPREIASVRRAGLVVWEAHQAAASLVRPGVTTAEINQAVEAVLEKRGALALFKGVPGKVPYPAATCVSVNDEVVHGIPGPRVLRPGDLVSIDIGARVEGWCADAAASYAVGEVSDEARRLLQVTEKALALALRLISQKERWSQVAREIERFARAAGFSPADGLVGHSIGREMWGGLQLPNDWRPEYSPRRDFPLVPGLVLAIEPMVNAGAPQVELLPDHWTMATADGSLSAHFEHTVALTEEGVAVLTAGPDGQGWSLPDSGLAPVPPD
ncbi:MAG: type I methionyl aminopeptidase [Armatimonadota bacterium]|nr:type I methionyl aminopeptidase [Armatimonadota bacterium]